MLNHPIKKLAAYSLDALGLPNLFLRRTARLPRLLLYHGVSPEIPDYGIFNYRQKFIKPESFRKHLIWLKTHFTILPLSYIIERHQEHKGIPEAACAITFDDGYENLYSHAFPVLKEFGIPAAVFLTTDFIDKKEPLWVDRLEYATGVTTVENIYVKFGHTHKKFSLASYNERCYADNTIRNYLKKIPAREAIEILEKIAITTGKDLSSTLCDSPYKGLSWGKIREMSNNGIEFAAHTLTHPVLARVSKEEARRQIKESHGRLKEELGKALPIFAYPNGQEEDFTELTISLLKEAGFTAALTAIPGYLNADSDLFKLPRFSLDGTNHMPIFRMTVSGAKAYLGRSVHRLKK